MQTSQLNWIDTHCHLYVDEFATDRKDMLARAISGGVTKLMMPNIDENSLGAMLELAKAYPDHCYPMMGLHPCSVKADFEQILDRMESAFENVPYIGVGETGIDLYWDKTFEKEQIKAFERQIGWAKKFDLPVIIHSRESLHLTIEVISHHQDGNLKGIFHCFSGTQEQVEQIHQLGFKVGIGGVLTYKKSGLAELLPGIPRSMLVLETDSPYLAPVPNRGKRNEPLFMIDVARKMAEVLEIDLAEVATLTSVNAEEVYGKKD